MAETNFGSLAKKIRGGESATTREMKSSPPEILISRRPNRQGVVGNVRVIRPIVSALNSRQIVVTLNGEFVGVLNENETIQCRGIPGENIIGVGTKQSVSTALAVSLANGMKKRFICGRTTGVLELLEAKI